MSAPQAAAPAPSPRDTFLASSALTPLPTTHFHDTGEQCPICRETDPFDTTDTRIIRTPCSHIFHHVCLAAWLNTLGLRHGTCPSCRAVLYKGTVADYGMMPAFISLETYMISLEILTAEVQEYEGHEALFDDDEMPALVDPALVPRVASAESSALFRERLWAGMAVIAMVGLGLVLEYRT